MYKLKLAESGGTYLPKDLCRDLGILRKTEIVVSAATIGDKKVMVIMSSNAAGDSSATQTS